MARSKSKNLLWVIGHRVLFSNASGWAVSLLSYKVPSAVPKKNLGYDENLGIVLVFPLEMDRPTKRGYCLQILNILPHKLSLKKALPQEDQWGGAVSYRSTAMWRRER